MEKRILFLLLLLLSVVAGNAQTVENPGVPDSSYPVTNLFSEVPYLNAEVYRYDNAVYRIAQKDNKYLLVGDFTNMSGNSGSALVVDTNFNTISNDHTWRINGEVKTAIPDGQGGFYIGGTFTQIGDSNRSHIAQLNSNGEPTAWNPSCDSVVKVILKRNDTLFIGGAFKTFAGQSRNCFAIYLISSNSLSPNGGGTGFPLMSTINSLVLHNDTILYAGKSREQFVPYHPIRKYNFKDNISMIFNLGFTEFGEIKFLQLSPDKTMMIYAAYYNGEYIKGITRFGVQVYNIDISMAQFYGNNTGSVYGLKVVGNKAYAAGYFNDIIRSSTVTRRGFFAFNPMTGSVYPENLNLPGYVRFLDEKDGRLFISGKFATVNGISREQFAVVDTGTLAVGNLQFTPTDYLNCMAFSGNRVFLGGVFKGLYSTKRNGLAAIDAQTKNITSWNPTITALSYHLSDCKRSFVKGDSLIILGDYGGQNENCIAGGSTVFKVFSISTGAELGVGAVPLEKVNDILLEGNYLYVSYDESIKRYYLPGLQQDISWGTNWSMTNDKHSLNYLISDSTKIYAIGDTRFYNCATTLSPKRGYVDVYDKNNGHTLISYHYQRANSDYDMVIFNHALLTGNKLYVQGLFDTLNGNPRRNFVCFDVNSGAITNWKVVDLTFPLTLPNLSLAAFFYTTDLKLYNGKIWFGSQPIHYLNTNFSGFASIDTLTGSIVSQPVNIGGSVINDDSNEYERLIMHDFIINDSVLVFAGRFDTLNNKPVRNFAVFHVNGADGFINTCPGTSKLIHSNISGNNYQWQMDSGSGFVDINDNANFSGTHTINLQLINIPSSWYGYTLRCRVDAAESDIFTIKISSTWTGSVNTAWEVAGNWGCGTVPDANTDVYINDGNINYPVVNSNAACRTIHANSSSLKVVTGKTLTITGKD